MVTWLRWDCIVEINFQLKGKNLRNEKLYNEQSCNT